MNAHDVLAVLEQYLQVFPNEKASLTLLHEQLTAKHVMNDRKTLPGHVTGSAFILSPDRTKLLLVHHGFLKRWLQPGGHWDPGESDPLAAARREAIEETSVQIAGYLPLDSTAPLLPIDIDSHLIPANPKKGEPEHYHHDFRYVFVAESEQHTGLEQEVDDIGWFAFDTRECRDLGRIVDKLTSHGII